jgi:YfaZ precursor
MNSFSKRLLVSAACILSAISLYSQTAGTQAHIYSADEGSTNASSSSTNSTDPSSPETNAAGWHFELSPYLWFAGTHGTVGALGRTASVHASAWDLLQHFNFGLMGGAEARHNRFLLTGDMLWIRLSDGAALPLSGLAATSVDVRVGQFIWTSKVGYRLIDRDKLKVDANVGSRYWHLGQKLNLNPSILGLNITASQSWADIVVGGRVVFPLGPKLSLTALGDVGGWNATAKLDYQIAGLVNFNVSPKWTLSAGYRYLFVDYRSGTNLYNMVTDGAVLGVTYRFK